MGYFKPNYLNEKISKLALKRKTEKIGFNMFMLHVQNNHFDKISDEAIEKHEKEINRLSELDEKKSIEDSENLWNIIFLEEELKALAEMKIIYAYKHFEISLKFMIKASYKNFEESQMFKWYEVDNFMKTKNIDIKKADKYNEINELREVNNAIKHSSISKSKISIVEFKSKDLITYKDILQFYKRIENSTFDFFISLNELIWKDLYEFDEVRLNEIVEKIEGRMEPEIAIKLANKILSKY
jgi:hypothetical protein